MGASARAGTAADSRQEDGSAEASGRASIALDDQLCFALYTASRVMTRAYRDVLSDLDLTYPQFLALVVLWESGEQTVAGLGRRLYLDSGTLTPLLKRLEAAGLVHRRRSRDDEREVVISLSERGRALERRAIAARAALGCRLGLSSDALGRLRGELFEVVTRLSGEADGFEAEGFEADAPVARQAAGSENRAPR